MVEVADVRKAKKAREMFEIGRENVTEQGVRWANGREGGAAVDIEEG